MTTIKKKEHPTRQRKETTFLRAKRQSRLAPWRLVSASDCMAYCFWKRLQCQARQAGDTEITYTHTHQNVNPSLSKISWRLCKIWLKHLSKLRCCVISSALKSLQWIFFWYLYLWSPYLSCYHLRSWLSNLSLFSRHWSTSFHLLKWHMSRFLSAFLNREDQSTCLNVLLNNYKLAWELV